MNGYTYNKPEEFTLIPEGDYECILKVEKQTTKTSGTEYISVAVRIRDDVDQVCKTRIVFDKIWKDKENPNLYNQKKINKLLGTQHLEEGHVFDTIDDVINFLNGAYVKAHINTSYDEYWQKDVNYVSYYKSSEAKPKTIGAKEEVVVDLVDDDDLPF